MILALSGCMFVAPPPHGAMQKGPDPLVEALSPLKDGDKAAAVSNLKGLLEERRYRCKAAFYLFALDERGEKGYLEIMRSGACRGELVPELSLITRLTGNKGTNDRYRRRFQACSKELNSCNARIKELRKELKGLEAENSRLLFELQKMEEIRRETEKWRLK